MQVEKLDANELSINTRKDDLKALKKSTKSLGTEESKKYEVTYSLERDPKYGFWRIKPSRGRIPDEISGLYTEKTKLYEDLYRIYPNAKVSDPYVKENRDNN